MNSKKKVLLVSDKDVCTSFGRLILDFEHALSSDFSVSILWLKTPRYFPPREEIIPGESIYASSLYTGFFSFRRTFREFLDKHHPDVVFFIRPELGFLVPIVRKVCRNAQTLVGIQDTFAETLYPHSLKFKLIALFFVRNTVCADGFVYGSRYARTEAESYYGIADRPNAVVGNPINLDVFYADEKCPDSETRRRFREQFGIVGFEGMCLNVSLDEPRKNLETYWRMAECRPHVAFVRIGKKTPGIQARLECGHLKNVFHFSGIPADMLRNFYRYADLFVCPSWLEGFGLPPLEALACGTPAVCAGTSGLKENLDGICPLVFPPDHVDGYLKVLDQVLRGELAIDAEKVRILLASFSMKSVAERLSRFLNQL
jgi:glycosyltransferase involved in cell wall biosynthesis